MSMDAEGLLRSQGELQGRIARAGENLKKAGVAKVTVGVVESRLQGLEANWKKFEANHDVLRTTHWRTVSKHEYVKKDFYEIAEEAYLVQRGGFLDLLSNLRVRSNEDTRSPAPSEGQSRRSLPRIQLPHFTGTYEEWPSFRDLFRSLVDRDTSLTNVEKLHYLKTSLRGEPEILVRNLPTTDENYARAWSTIKDHYENKRMLVRSCIAAFIALPQLRSESAHELKRVLHGTITAGTLESIGRPISDCSDMFVHLVVEKLDPPTRREWETSISGTHEPPSYEKLRTFLEARVRTLEVLHANRPETQPKPSNKSARTHLVQRQGSRKNCCSLCSKEHYILFCEDFKKRDAKARKDIAVINRLCFNCFGKHTVAECQSKFNCSTCHERHHSSIHDACTSSVSAATAPFAPANKAATSLHIHRRIKHVTVLLATARVDVSDRFGTRHPVRALVDAGSEVSIVSEALVQRLRLPRTAASIDVYGVGGQRTGVARGRVAMTMFATTGDFSTRLSALILPQVTCSRSRIGLATESWPHVVNLPLADPAYAEADQIDLLLGADVFTVIVEEGLLKGGPGSPVAQKTALGWIPLRGNWRQ